MSRAPVPVGLRTQDQDRPSTQGVEAMTVTYLEDFVAGQRFSSRRMAVEREHIERLIGSPIVALGSDTARQGIDVKASFEAGIKARLEVLGRLIAETDGEEPNGKAMAILSTMVGALILSRAVDDERLSKRFLQAAANGVLMASSASNAPQGPLQ
jgi:hypothetical protein